MPCLPSTTRWSLVALLLATTPAITTAQGVRSESKSAILTYMPGNAQRNGYESAGLWFSYHFAPCVGTSVQVMTQMVLIHFQANVIYWYDGKRLPVPGHLTGAYREVVPGQVRFRATVNGPGTMQERDLTAFMPSSDRCSGWTHTGVQQKDLWEEKATPEQKRQALGRLSVSNGTTLEPLRNPTLERYYMEQNAAARRAEQQKVAQARTDSTNKARAEQARRDSIAAAQRAQANRPSGTSTASGAAGTGTTRSTAADPWGGSSGGSNTASGSRTTTGSTSGSTGTASSAPRPFNEAYGRDNQGNHYRRDANGQWQRVNQDEYNAALTQERQRVAQNNAAAQRQQQADANAAAQANFQRQQAANAARTAQIERTTQAFQQSFYAAQAVNRSRDNVRDLSQLDGNYSSAAELEADFQRRMAAVQQELRTMETQQAQARQAGVQAIMGDAPEGMKEVAGMIGAIAAQREREKQEREARQRMQQQRTRLLAEMEQKRVAALRQMRHTLVAQFPEGGVPLSFHRVQGEVLYFFSYAVDRTRLNDATPAVVITNTFPVARLADGSWPYKASLSNELRARTSGAPTLVGFYATQQLAESMRQSFVRIARQSGMSVSEVTYAGRPRRGGSAGVAQADAWSGSSSTSGASSGGADPWAPQAGAARSSAPDPWGGAARPTTSSPSASASPASSSSSSSSSSTASTIRWRKGEAPPFGLGESEACSYRAVDGEFVIINRGERTCGTFRASAGGDFRLTADLRLTSVPDAGAAGLRFGVGASGNHVLSMDRRGNVWLFEWDGTSWTTHASVRSTAVRTDPSAVNEVVVQVAGLALDVYVNGVHTVGHRLAQPLSGGVGLWANRAVAGQSEPTQAALQRFLIEPLK